MSGEWVLTQSKKKLFNSNYSVYTHISHHLVAMYYVYNNTFQSCSFTQKSEKYLSFYIMSESFH